MPVPTRRQAQQYQFPPPEEADDTDSDVDITGASGRGDDDGETIGEEQVDFEDDLEDEDALASPDQPGVELANLDPPPSYLREISASAAWTASSSKPGCSVPQLRHPSTALFWQSDGPQPHYLNIHFFKLVRIAGLRLYLDFEQDESYTPTRIIFLAGSGMNDLQEWGEMRLESPRGWIWADFSGVGDPDSSDDESEVGDEPQLTIQDVASNTTGSRPQGANASSDSENAAPRPQTSRATADDIMQLTPQLATPNATHFAAHHTPQGQHRNDTTNTTPFLDPHNATLTTPTIDLPRPNPRHPFTSLTPTAPQHTPPRHHRRRKTPKMPILRAHLVQIKILENHQNGKDTHLRGLQIFARNDEDEVSRGPMGGLVEPVARTVVVAGGGAGGEVSVVRREERKAERFDLGAGSRSAWDVEPSIR
ncbi:hypothetical protein J1614_007020 [Plenodomus biglobosus]|nr:hypothetical protein J1614_007020 [Plenodomus biglobosus]